MTRPPSCFVCDSTRLERIEMYSTRGPDGTKAGQHSGGLLCADCNTVVSAGTDPDLRHKWRVQHKLDQSTKPASDMAPLYAAQDALAHREAK